LTDVGASDSPNDCTRHDIDDEVLQDFSLAIKGLLGFDARKLMDFKMTN
jgi:hypothetical protein